jgi:hypothetical protein
MSKCVVCGAPEELSCNKKQVSSSVASTTTKRKTCKAKLKKSLAKSGEGDVKKL